MELDRKTIVSALREVFEEYLGRADAEMANKWIGGEVVLKPGSSGAQEKTMAIDAFFHKIVMARDQLRLLEQKINTPRSRREEGQWQQHLSRIYGSLTSFNVLFADADDRFVGQKGERR
jgi:hypothetical protein